MPSLSQFRFPARDLSVLTASLGLVSYAVPLFLSVVALDSRWSVHGVLLTILVILPGLMGVFAAWRGNVILVWTVTAAFIALWLLWWRHFLPFSGVPVLYSATAVLTTISSPESSAKEAAIL